MPPPPRLHVDRALADGAELDLPPGAARHVQVLRLQPGAALLLFDGRGGEAPAAVTRIGRSAVAVRVTAPPRTAAPEAAPAVTLALGVPANDRMDALVEKATELGAAAIVPLACERSVLRLAGERAERRTAHWQGVAVAACEQSGRSRVPAVVPVQPLAAWLDGLPALPPPGECRWLLSLAADALAPAAALAAGPLPPQAVVTLSGPEGGLSPAEEALVRARGFVPVGLGPRTLRADTAPLAVLAWLMLGAAG